MFLRGFEGWHLVIIVGLLVVLFGARKMPDAARSIGQSLRIFKSEMKAARDDEPDTAAPSQPGQAAPSTPPAVEAKPGSADALGHGARQHDQREHTSV
jgi:sec-independent protein translocase protein TatA